MSKEHPVFDSAKPHGTIAHGDLRGEDPSSLPAFIQDGHYFKPDKSYHSPDGQPRKRSSVATGASAPEAPAIVNTKPGVPEAEVDALLEDPQAELLLELPRDQIIALVTAANGPVIAGERSTQIMVAWLIKNTAKSNAGQELL